VSGEVREISSVDLWTFFEDEGVCLIDLIRSCRFVCIDPGRFLASA